MTVGKELFFSLVGLVKDGRAGVVLIAETQAR